MTTERRAKEPTRTRLMTMLTKEAVARLGCKPEDVTFTCHPIYDGKTLRGELRIDWRLSAIAHDFTEAAVISDLICWLQRNKPRLEDIQA